MYADTVSLWTPAFWRAVTEDAVHVPVRAFDRDFRVMIEQLAEEVECDVDVLVVRRQPAGPLVRDAQQMPLDLDRYPGVAAFDLHERGLISTQLLNTYDTPAGFAQLKQRLAALQLPDVYRYGLQQYLDRLAAAIERGDPVPPILTVNGALADGRHRALAARQLGRTWLPVAEISASCA